MKKIIFSLSFFFLIYLIYNDLPYKNTLSEYQFFLSIIRIVYYSIFIIYLVKLKELSRIQFNENFKELTIICNTLIAVSLFIVIGIFTKFFVILHFIIYLYLFRISRANFFGIEQSYHQIVGIFFIFSNSNLYFSLDKLLQIEKFFIYDDSTSLNFLVLSISVCLVSGFYEKLNSKLWRSGKALSIFLNLPHIAKAKFSQTLEKIFFKKYFCYIALINQALLFVLLLNDLRLLFYIGELIFSICLTILTPISYIGTTFTIIFSFLITNELVNLNYISFVRDLNLKINFYEFYFIKYLLGLLILNSLTSCFYNIPNFFKKINRYSLGLFPFDVYTEIHIYGIRVFKVSGFYNSKLIYNSLFEIYNEQGKVGPKNVWQPSIILGLTYRITDICEKKLKNNSTQNDKEILCSLFKNIIDLNRKKIGNTNTLKLYTKTINPTDHVNGEKSWIDKEWSEIAQFKISEKNSFQWTGLPSIANKIFRK